MLGCKGLIYELSLTPLSVKCENLKMYKLTITDYIATFSLFCLFSTVVFSGEVVKLSAERMFIRKLSEFPLSTVDLWKSLLP